MSAEPTLDHLQRPHLRRIQPLGLNKDGQQFVALRDPTMLCEQTVVVPAAAMRIVQYFRGEHTVDQIAQQVGGSAQQVSALAKRLDEVGLLWGPTSEEMELRLKKKILDRGSFPIKASASMGKTEAECRQAMQGWFDETDDPELGAAPVGIVAPHLDYQRGWPNYAAAYHGWREASAPDRVVILGTNHFGLGDGVVLTECGFESPVGRCPADTAVIKLLVDRFGPPVVIDQLDHVAEHSIELQLPWLQQCFGNVPVVAALIPDPLAAMIEDEGTHRIALQPFVEGLRAALDEVGGTTFFIASSDLSHVGPQFGEPRPIDQQRRTDVERHDRDMMGKFLTGDAEEFLGAARWNNNPTRWCSLGSMAAILMLAQPKQVELIDYRQAVDEKGMALISSAAMALL